jgi:hypothetical protein
LKVNIICVKEMFIFVSTIPIADLIPSLEGDETDMGVDGAVDEREMSC